jgi:aminodeoxyfutalosine synthase
MELHAKIKNKALSDIAEKLANNIPVNRDDVLCMLRTNDILELGAIANHVRRALHGDAVYYGVNTNLNYTNICELRCPLCAFSRDEDDPDSYIMGLEEIKRKVRRAVELDIDEVHIVGGLHPGLKIDYFEEILRSIKSIKPDMFIVAFSAVEYDYFSKINNIPLKDLFKRLIAAGLDSLPGGGAEIFSPKVRKIIAPKKISGERWLEVMATAHEIGLKTNATMLYNHIEGSEDIADHLLALRGLQDATGGFKTFVPLPFHEENTRIKAKRKISTGYDDIRIYATSRIVLRNVPHLKALWMYLGEKMAQTLLSFGVDDIGATYINERVVHSAGAATPDFGTEQFLARLIESAGFKPVRTNAGYNQGPQK